MSIAPLGIALAPENQQWISNHSYQHHLSEKQWCYGFQRGMFSPSANVAPIFINDIIRLTLVDTFPVSIATISAIVVLATSGGEEIEATEKTLVVALRAGPSKGDTP